MIHQYLQPHGQGFIPQSQQGQRHHFQAPSQQGYQEYGAAPTSYDVHEGGEGESYYPADFQLPSPSISPPLYDGSSASSASSTCSDASSHGEYSPSLLPASNPMSFGMGKAGQGLGQFIVTPNEETPNFEARIACHENYKTPSGTCFTTAGQQSVEFWNGTANIPMH